MPIKKYSVCLPLNIKNTHKMSNAQRVTAEQLMEIVKPITKSTFIGLCYQVDESKSKTKGGKKQLQKQVCLTATLNHDYTKKVIKLSGDTSFVADPMKGKTRISNTIIQSDKTGAYMLYATVLKSAKRETTYFHNELEISREDAIQRELFAPSYFNKPTTKGRGLVNEADDFGLISPYLERLVWANVNGVEYEVIK